MKTFKVVSLLLALHIFLSSNGQIFERNYDIPVTVNGNQLANPWAGGLNSCQLSRIDVNLDGKKDLFIFDRIGSRINIFLNMDDAPGVINYKYTLAYNHLFPANLRNWVLLRDMNCDGKEDICANSGSGVRVYWNQSDTELTFSMAASNLQAYYDFGSNPFYNTVYCISPDIPAINDYDGDGDMDIWSWNEYSTSMYFYKNQAVENGECDSPDFICRNRCYGQFGESTESFEIFTGEDFECDFNVVDPREETILRHTGGTTLALDLDQDGLRDLVIGDVTENFLAAMMVDESISQVDSVTFVHYDFPAQFSNTTVAEMTTFLGAFYEDINNDGISDLVVSPNTFTDAADRESFILYINNGFEDLPDFEYVQQDFLQADMIDLGISAYPVVFDLNNDGLKDLLVANRKYFELGNNFTSRIWFYRNIGTANEPAFVLADDNWMNIPSYEWQSVYPAFGDLDGDGDADMIIGDLEGAMHYFTNVAASGAPANFELTMENMIDANGDLIDVGQYVCTQIVDLNDDNKPDLLIGELNGNINYYENTGTVSDYAFTHVADTLGGVVATSILGIQGKSVPYFFKNTEGNYELIVGTETGQINHYNNITNNLSGTFNLVTNNYENIKEGERCGVFLSDITSDGLLDLFLGNVGGGLGIYTHLPIGIHELDNTLSLAIFPNPAADGFRLTLPQTFILPGEISIIDASGRIVRTSQATSESMWIDCANLAQGVYQVVVRNDQSTVSGKFLKK